MLMKNKLTIYILEMIYNRMSINRLQVIIIRSVRICTFVFNVGLQVLL